MKRKVGVLFLVLSLVLCLMPTAIFAQAAIPAAQIGENSYETLSAAVEAAKEGETVELLSDVAENIIVDKDITIRSIGEKKTIAGEMTLKKGTLENLTVEILNTKHSFVIGSAEDNAVIKLEQVKVLFPLTSEYSAITQSGNQADIVIENCLFTNAAENGGKVENAKQWSYGLYVNEQGESGSFTFKSSEFNGAFRTMLPNISGAVNIENSKFINSVYSVANGPVGGAADEATCITTADSNLNAVITGNTFDNAGAFYFQKAGEDVKVYDNIFIGDKFEHYIQVRKTAASKLDLTRNSFTMGDNDLVIIDVAAAPVILPAGQKAVSYWPWAETAESIRPADYSSYVYAYNADGTKTFYPGTAAALSAFIHPNDGNIGVDSVGTVILTSDMTLDSNTVINIAGGKDITFVVPEGITLTISGNDAVSVSGKLHIIGDGVVVVSESGKVSVESGGTLQIETPVENNGAIENNGTLELSQSPDGNGNINGTGQQQIKHNKVTEVPEKAPTCTESGNIRYWYCSDEGCGKYFKNASLTEEIEKKDIYVAVKDHHFENGACIWCGAKDPNYNPPTPPSVTYYDITAAQPEHGTITLEHDRIYRYGDVDVTLTAEEGYEVKDLLLNGVSVGAVSSYTIKGVTEDIHVTAVFGETEAAKNDRIAKGVQNTTIRMYYKKDEIGKGWIKLRFKKSFGYKVDNYEIFRSAKKKTSFGEKPWFVTKTNKTSGYYKNGKSVKKGTRYFYKMRGVREIAGETYYTQWSNIVMRTGR